MIETSICLMVTAGWLMPSTHAVSHGAGHSRPVNSGKLFVACSRSIASRQSPRQARSFHSGIRLPSGQPWWQNGMPQSMQRPAWRRSTVAVGGPRRPLSSPAAGPGTGRRGGSSRSRTLRKPFGSATGHLHDPGPDDVAVEVEPLGLGACLRTATHARVVARHDLGEPGQRRRPSPAAAARRRPTRSPRGAADDQWQAASRGPLRRAARRSTSSALTRLGRRSST